MLEVLPWNRSASHQPRMATFQTCDKIDILHPKTLSDMTLSERNNSIFQSNEKIRKIAYFFAQAFLTVLRTQIRWCNLATCLIVSYPLRIKIFFYLTTLIPSYINFKYSSKFSVLESFRLKFCTNLRWVAMSACLWDVLIPRSISSSFYI